MTADNTSENQGLLVRTARPAPRGPFDPLSPVLPPEVRRLAGWIIGTGLFPDPDRARRWLRILWLMPRPWITLTSSEFRARVLARFTGHLTGTDERTRQRRADVRRALELLSDNLGDDNPILAAGCGSMTAARVVEMRDWIEGADVAALERRTEELRALFEADESYREREAVLRSAGWKLLPCFGDSPYAERPRNWFVGKRVQVGFASRDGTVEHMWIAVTGVAGRKLVGALTSEPAMIRSLLPGDRVELKRSHVQSVVAGGDDS